MLVQAVVLFGLLATPALGDLPWTIDVVCDAAASFLAVLTKAHPYEVDFPAGTTPDGQPYPAGTLTHTSLTSHNCSADHSGNKTTFNFSTVGGLRATLPSFSFLGKNVYLVITASAVTLKVTYQASEVDGKTLLSPLTTGVEGLGTVMISMDNAPPTDWTHQATGFILPVLVKAFNDYINTYRFTVDHPLGVYGSVTSLVEAYLYTIHKSY